MKRKQNNSVSVLLLFYLFF